MNVLMVTSKIKEENVADAEAAVDKLIQALEQTRLEGVRYAVTRLSDGVTVAAFLVMEPGQEHPLRTFPEYTELLEDLKQWQAESAVPELMTVLGSYRLF